MGFAFKSRLSRVDKVLLVGSDSPAIEKEYIESALKALDDYNVVLGPAEDGGYVLIGMSSQVVYGEDERGDRGMCDLSMLDPIFANVVWGGDQVLRQTTLNLRNLGLSFTLLPMLWDVDEEVDYVRWKKKCSVNRPCRE
jgi:hypothetical protein